MSKDIDEIFSIASKLVNKIHESRTKEPKTIESIIIDIINNEIDNFELEDLQKLSRKLKSS